MESLHHGQLAPPSMPFLGDGVCYEAFMRLRIRTLFQIHNYGLGCGPVRIVFPQFHWRQGKGIPPSFTSICFSFGCRCSCTDSAQASSGIHTRSPAYTLHLGTVLHHRNMLAGLEHRPATRQRKELVCV